MPFRYLRDPLFLASVALYFVNRLVLRPAIYGGALGSFLHGSLNDVLCIPFWVPIMVWMMRKTGLRTHDDAPTGMEILVPLLLWAWFFELVLPKVAAFKGLATSDAGDVLCYTVGAAIAVGAWDRVYGNGNILKPTPPRPEGF
jgi:hypothetical protein